VHEEQDVTAGPGRRSGEARAPGSFAFDDRGAGFSKSGPRRRVGPAVGDEDLAARVAGKPRKTLDDVETLPSNRDDD
jgi:hypothetical protein